MKREKGGTFPAQRTRLAFWNGRRTLGMWGPYPCLRVGYVALSYLALLQRFLHVGTFRVQILNLETVCFFLLLFKI
jgi:hypothetical protein